jgi:cobalt-zinc-cadmium efflux system outer membrane protein
MPVGGLAQPARLDEGTAIQLALARPAVDALLTGQSDAARAEATIAGTWDNPEFDFEREFSNGFAGEGTETLYRFSQVLNLSGSRALRASAAQRRVRALGHEADTYRLELTSEIRRLFFAVLKAERVIDAAQQWAERLSAVERVVQRRVTAGEASRYDRQRIAQERISVATQIAETRAQREANWQKLLALVGPAQAGSYVGVTGPLLPELPAPLEGLLASLEERPEFKSLSVRGEALAMERQAAERAIFPDIKLGAGVKTIEGRSGSDNRFVFSTSIPLPLFNQQQGERARIDSNARVNEAQYRLALDRTRSEIAGTWHRVRALHQVASEQATTVLRPTEELTRVAEAAYRAGESGVLELVDAYRTAFDVQRRGLDLELEVRLGRIELDRLTGGQAR